MMPLAPTLFSNDEGYLLNPKSDSGTSWWHMTSPYRVITRFNIPSYFSADIESSCRIAETLNRNPLISLWEVRIKAEPRQIFSPQTIFKDWLHIFHHKDVYKESWRRHDEEGWESIPVSKEDLTPLGLSFYQEVLEGRYEPEEDILADLVVSEYGVFDNLKHDPKFEKWCRRNDIVGWLEGEFRDAGWAVDEETGMWMPEDGFNLGIWNTELVQIVSVFRDIINCDDDMRAVQVAVGRKNPPIDKVENMNIDRALSLIYDLAATYEGIPFEEIPPQYVIYAHSVTSEMDTLRMLVHNANSGEIGLWGYEVSDDLHAEPDAEGFIFWAIVQLEGHDGDTLLVSIFDKRADTFRSYMVDLETSQMEETSTPFFFEGFAFSSPPTLH